MSTPHDDKDDNHDGRSGQGHRSDRRDRDDYDKYLDLADREACDEPLTPEERSFCRSFEKRHPAARAELKVYTELSQLNALPDAASRALVDRTLAQLEADDVDRASEEVKMLRGPRVPYAAIVAAAAFALGAGYAMLKGTGGTTARSPSSPLARAELVYASGTVKISDGNGPAGRTLLSEGSLVETQDGAACVLIDADINVCLAAHSRMRLRNIAGPARIVDLELGKLATRLSTQPEGMSLSIVADGIASTAVGTAYSVERQPEQGVVTTTVLHGKVRVGRDAETLVVSAHERAVSTTNPGAAARPTVASVRRAEEAPSWAMLGPTTLWRDPVAATLDVQSTPIGAEAWLDDQWLGVTPVSSLIPAGDHHLSVRRHNVELLSRDLHLNAGDSQEVRCDDAELHAAQATDVAGSGGSGDVGRDEREEASRGSSHSARRGVRREHARNTERHAREAEAESAADEPTAATSESTSVLSLRQARQAVRAGEFRTAANLYEQLAAGSPGSEEASTAMVLLGQLRLNQLNDPRGALAPLGTYLKHGGPLAVEARVARIEALRRLNRPGEEATAIDEFLRLHPRSFEVKRLQARLDVLRSSSAQ